MSDVLKDLQPKKVFEYFETINNIPRGSGNEQAISDYMVKFATDLGLEVQQDEANNIYIKKPATPGYEDQPTVILQGHMDMVCEKNKDTVHDFEKDGLKLYIDGDWIGAHGTTLGGDDGIAIAYQMAILADNTLKHPALECLMTTDEERGMTGVERLHPEYLQGKILINVDNESEGEFLVSCAGGAKAYLTLPYEKVEVAKDAKLFKLTINGLKGGHSGGEIHFERANAHILMARVLNHLRNHFEFNLVSLEGGTKDNVITRECEVVIAIQPSHQETLRKEITQMGEIFKAEYVVQDPAIAVMVEEVPYESQAICDEAVHKMINLMLTIPNGVMAYDQNMKGLVQTSLNLGIVKIEEHVIRFGTAVRSSVASRKEELLTRLKAVSEAFNCHFEIKGDYPAWQYKEESRIRDMAVELYEEMYHKKPIVTAIHAGLECGFIAEKCPGLDMISLGPDMKDIHSPEEVLSISSTKRVYEYIVNLLEKLATY